MNSDRATAVHATEPMPASLASDDDDFRRCRTPRIVQPVRRSHVGQRGQDRPDLGVGVPVGATDHVGDRVEDEEPITFATMNSASAERSPGILHGRRIGLPSGSVSSIPSRIQARRDRSRPP